MAAALAAPVHAADVANPTGTMEVEYKQASSWVVSIPKTTLSATNNTEQSVTASSINMRPEQTLQVKIKDINPIGNTTGKIYFSAIDPDTKAGDYRGTVTYTMTAV